MKAGITGHQNIGSSEDISWVRQTLHELIVAHDVTHGFTSLAIGADQLFAEVLAGLDKNYTFVLPCSEYEGTFKDGSDILHYRALRDAAEEIIRLPFEQAEEQAFLWAGKRVVELSGIMIAVWNGLPAKGVGGTGDVVLYSLSRSLQVIHLNPVNHTIALLDRTNHQSSA